MLSCTSSAISLSMCAIVDGSSNIRTLLLRSSGQARFLFLELQFRLSFKKAAAPKLILRRLRHGFFVDSGCQIGLIVFFRDFDVTFTPSSSITLRTKSLKVDGSSLLMQLGLFLIGLGMTDGELSLGSYALARFVFSRPWR